MVNDPSVIKDGDLALIVSAQKKRYIINLSPGQQLQTHRGVIRHDDLIGIQWGSRITSHLGSPYVILQPSMADLLIETKRNTQILYPKDIGYILLNLDIGPGKKVIEAGSGSGAFTSALAFSVGKEGHVYSYDNREQLQNLAIKNIAKLGFEERVTFKCRDIEEGFEEKNADAIFLDLPNPYAYLTQVRAALKPGGFFGTLLPTVNQVVELLHALHQAKFSFIDVCEILLRYYKNSYTRFRPTDRMVAHTGFLIFARPVIGFEDETTVEPDEIEIG